MKGLKFYKMTACGNDFIIIDNRESVIEKNFENVTEFVKNICRRNLSVGADGVILVEKSNVADFGWRFFNSDGSEAEMCGNGGRCVARFAYEMGIASNVMRFETKSGIIRAEVSGKRVKIELTEPHSLKLDYEISLNDREIFISSVNTGVPHVVLVYENIESAPVSELGREIRFHSAFSPGGTNVNFVKVLNSGEIMVRTYERGVEGETYACGTGAVASAVVLNKKDMVGDEVNVITRGGEILKVYLRDGVFLEGEVRFVFEGRLHQEALN
ncbi:MAG: diaminopimelate epimerase [Desulfobacterota bacterium]|nr:diaminopimelate epimerase [Thermodesulfobacteriota bacterium]MDW8001240.1 diaminopimelate epimerase [Deltaproteobacteria bacterium]